MIILETIGKERRDELKLKAKFLAVEGVRDITDFGGIVLWHNSEYTKRRRVSLFHVVDKLQWNKEGAYDLADFWISRSGCSKGES